MAPLFCGQALPVAPGLFPQYGLLAENLSAAETDADYHEGEVGEAEADGAEARHGGVEAVDPRVFLNVSTPSSMFICGSQGSGKSHTLSCVLESCLIANNEMGKLKNPLAGIVFHWDKFVSYGTSQVCEAAYLASSGITVRVLCSPTNIWSMRRKYENIDVGPQGKKPVVIPMLFKDKQLDVRKMMDMMAVTNKEEQAPLYVEVCHSSS